MSLKHAILGFLKNGPKTGYDLQKKIDITISHFWPSTQSQIYRTLSEMAGENLLEAEIHYQDEKPNKKIYSITEKGELELRRWLSEPLAMTSHRNQFLVQLFFSRDLPRADIIANMEHYSEELKKREDFLNSREAQGLTQTGKSPVEKTIFEIIVDNGLQVIKSERSWVDKSIQRLKNAQGGQDAGN